MILFVHGVHFVSERKRMKAVLPSESGMAR
jgi:hypothetical protein